MIFRYLLVSIICICLSVALHGQIDKEFWFVAPEVSDQHGDEPIFLRLNTFGQSANVTVTMPANPSFTPINVSIGPSSSQSIDLTSRKNLVENRPYSTVLNKGLRIVSSSEITAYYEVADPNNPEIFPLKGRNALGKRFFVPAQNDYYNQVGRAAIDIVATENNTTISVRITDNIQGYSAGDTVTFVLDKGETYSLWATNTAAPNHFGGTLIYSDKPIAVTVSDDSIYSNFAWDLIGDQIVPVNIVGTEYIAVAGNSTAERVYIVATEDNTDIFINGNTTPTNTINEGDLQAYTISGNSMYIQTSAPVYVLHLSGFADEFGDALLPPIVCTGSQEVGFIRTSGGTFNLILLVESGNEDDFVVNGNTTLINPGFFNAVPGTNGNWMAARIDLNTFQIPVGSNFIENTEGLFHLGILNNLGQSAEYGYFSNYSSLNLGEDATICDGDTLVLDAGNEMDTYLWYNGDTTQTHGATTPGVYWVETTINTCTLRDTIIVTVNYINLDLGPDTSICHYDDLLLDADANSPWITYEWLDGSTNPFYLTQDSGSYHVTLTDTLGCQNSDTIHIAYNPQVVLGPDTSFVCDSLSYTLMSGIPNGIYTWQDGATTQNYFVDTVGTYWVQVIDASGCVSADTTIVSFVTSPVTDLGQDTLLCEGDSLILDAIIPIPREYIWQDGSGGQYHTVYTSGLYYVQAIDEHGCFDRDSIVIDYFLSDEVSLGPDSTLCDGFTIDLTPNISGIAYTWQDGATDMTYTVSQEGEYIVGVTNNLNCTAYDTVLISYIQPPEDVFTLPSDTTVCEATPLILNAGQEFATSYYWEGFSAYFGQNDPNDSVFIVTLPGEYQVTIANPCGINTHTVYVEAKDCSCQPFVPNAFTPNNDGNNDIFYILSGCEVANFQLQIFDRWGALVFETTDITQGWDGTIGGEPAMNGVYVWRLNYSGSDNSGEAVDYLKSGDLTLVR